LTAMRDRYRDMIMIQKIQYLEVRSKVAVSPVETERFYRENPEKFVMPEAFHVSSITIRKKSARESELARQKLLGLRKRIVEGGVPFDEVARQNSEDTHAAEGGDMGWISRGDFIPQLEEAIFRLKPKEVTPVLESDIGWHLFRLEEHRAKKTKTFEETKEQIEGYLYSEKSRKRFEEWVARLRKDAYISIR